MENIENTVAAENPATIEDAPQQEEFSAEAIMNNLAAEPQQEEAPAQEETQQEEPAAEQTRENEIENGVKALFEDGWTAEELTAFSQDDTVRREIQAGKDVMRVANAYLRRANAPKAQARKGVPTFRSAATSGAKTTNRIEDMSDEEFARFSDRMYEEAMSGKRIRI